jgi:hypothetical protein
MCYTSKVTLVLTPIARDRVLQRPIRVVYCSSHEILYEMVGECFHGSRHWTLSSVHTLTVYFLASSHIHASDGGIY